MEKIDQINEGELETNEAYKLIEALENKPITLLAERSEYTYEELETFRRENNLDIIYACDFLVKNIEER